ncbi:MAG: CBM57 [uncultured Cytophagales bacterium]|uniref:CBM57 n=1 Tax=uncultured Cytophagales bacterium TaxID=158755 RepID=A0A6J4IIT0_9SPHI|nr:MAG: CBM57 [uncultured Cytophagales bacterium]
MQHLNYLQPRFLRTALPLLAAFLFAIHLSAQPVLVKDINADAGRGGSSEPSKGYNVNGTLFFAANNGVNGRELWKTDGTAAGTVLVKDIHPGTGGAAPAPLVHVNKTLFFLADDGVHGIELWKTDGTAAGTAMLKDITPPGSNEWNSADIAVLNGTVYFRANSGVYGRELWKTDGTAAGTVLVKNIVPESGGLYPGSSSPAFLKAVNGVLYFAASDAQYDRELWRTDGTEAGTFRVSDLVPGPASSNPRELTDVNGTLYFLATAGNRTALYKSDGTEAGTEPVKWFTAPHGVYGMLNVNGTLYFSGGDETTGQELWKSNGTEAGTTLVKDIRPGPEPSLMQSFTVLNNTLYFVADDGVRGRELWKTDGTAAGTVPVKDLFPGAGQAIPQALTVMGNLLYFSAADGTNGHELWVTNGTEAGTTRVKDINPGSGSSSITWMTAVNNTLYFSGFDGNEAELWKSNGTAAGTVPVRNIRPGTPGSSPNHLTAVNGTVYFAARDAGSGTELWKSNGTAAGTVRVGDIAPGAAGSSPAWLTNVNGTLYFAANDGTTGTELWKSDGITATRVKDIRAGARGSNPAWLTDVNGTLYFAAGDSLGGQELWRSDGTATGTVRVRNINPGANPSTPEMLTNVNGVLYFTANDGIAGPELWRSNGTAAGTTRVRDIFTGPSGAFPVLSPAYAVREARFTHDKGILYFAANDGINGPELWRSDGTAAGTRLVKDIHPGAAGGLSFSYGNNYDVRKMLILNGALYLAANDGTNGQELWKSDGTAAGTVLFKDITPGQYGSHPGFLTNANGTLYFTASVTMTIGSSSSTGQGVWKSDGTADGTQALIEPGRVNSAYSLVAVGNRVFFPAFKFQLHFDTEGTYGNVGGELWSADAATGEVLLVKDLAPGPEGSMPFGLINVNGTLYFAAGTGYEGRELWKFTPGACTTPNAALAVAGGTVCSGAPSTVQVKGSQAGVTYQLYLGDSPLGAPAAGGGDIVLSVPGNLLLPATYTLRVRASGCAEVPLAQTANLSVLPAVVPPTAAGVTVSAGSPARLTASGAPAGSGYRWYGAASGGSPLATGATYTTPALSASTTYYVSVFREPGCESARVPVPVTIAGSNPLRVNAGGGAFTTPQGNVFAADGNFAGGTVSTIAGGEVAGTTSDALYHNLRVGTGFSYALPTGNGYFNVTLHFNETWWGYRTAGGVGSRQFNVDVEGSRRLTNYDIFAAAGGAMRARVETFRVRVADGTLNIAFSKGLADNPAVAAIEVVPASPAQRINAGGPAHVTAGGQTFVADVSFTGGSVSALSAGEVANTTEDALYRSIRFGPAFSYSIPVSNATYGVFLHFNETWWGSRTAGGVGSRRFNVDVEGSRRLTNYDIFAAAGGAMRARVEAFSVTVTDGVLDISFSKGLADNPSIAAIEVVPAPGGRLAATGSERGQTGAVLYPNPVRDKLYVSLGGPAADVLGTTLTDALGVVRRVNGHRVQAANTLEVDVRTLRPGAYLLGITTAGETRLLRFVKQ